MKHFLITTLFFILTQVSFGQTDYMNKGNQQLGDEDFVGAEQTFREAISFPATSPIPNCSKPVNC